MLGIRLASIYSYPPSSLGFCGQRIKNTPQILKNFLTGKKPLTGQIKKALQNFEAAYPYLKLISQANKIKDPLDYQVVEALWLGNELLNKIKLTDLKKTVLTDFTRPGLLTKTQAKTRLNKISALTRPHHSFHVLLLGPVTKNIKFYDKLYDLCLISWGRVLQLKAKKSKAVVNFKPLILKNNQFLYGKKSKKEIIWNKTIVPDLQINDQVSFHWNFLCQKLTETQATNLKKYTKQNINLANEQRR